MKCLMSSFQKATRRTSCYYCRKVVYDTGRHSRIRCNPGRTTRLSAIFAKRILLAFEEAAQYFPAKKVRVVGNPIRKELMSNYGDTASLKKEMQLNEHLPNILVLGGSQGSTRVNNFILDSLHKFLPEMQVTHQTGTANFEEVQEQAKSILKDIDESLRARYHPYDYFTANRLKEALGAADLVISRTGASAIFEIAVWKTLNTIPLSDSQTVINAQMHMHMRTQARHPS